MRKICVNKKILFLMDTVIVAVLLILDQFTKHLAVVHLKDQPALPLIEGVLELDYLENRGVAFGMFQNQRFMILLTGIVFMAVILFVMYKMPVNKKFTILHIVLSCIMAGGIGNMIDRVTLGYVVDFISFVLINFPIFNVADCYVVCATIVLFIVYLFVLKEEDLDFLSFRKAKEK